MIISNHQQAATKQQPSLLPDFAPAPTYCCCPGQTASNHVCAELNRLQQRCSNKPHAADHLLQQIKHHLLQSSSKRRICQTKCAHQNCKSSSAQSLRLPMSNNSTQHHNSMLHRHNVSCNNKHQQWKWNSANCTMRSHATPNCTNLYTFKLFKTMLQGNNPAHLKHYFYKDKRSPTHHCKLTNCNATAMPCAQTTILPTCFTTSKRKQNAWATYPHHQHRATRNTTHTLHSAQLHHRTAPSTTLTIPPQHIKHNLNWFTPIFIENEAHSEQFRNEDAQTGASHAKDKAKQDQPAEHTMQARNIHVKFDQTTFHTNIHAAFIKSLSVIQLTNQTTYLLTAQP